MAEGAVSMNVYKKMMIVISATITSVSLATLTNVFASYTTNNTYNTNEPYGYVVGTSNTGDTFWVCGTQYCRLKCDSSSVYVNNTSNNGDSLYMDLWGKQEGSNTKIHVGCPSAGANHVFRDEDIFVPNDGPRFLNQYINERNIKYACVRFFSPGGGSGYWSPDSYGSYPVINTLP
jgi:hypothetical protein